LNRFADKLSGTGLLSDILEDDDLADKNSSLDSETDPLVNEEGDGAPDNNITVPEALQDKLDRPLEKKDLIQAGLIILGKLDKEDINFLFQVGNQDSYTKEELLRVRRILLAKLTSKEIHTLKELGAKYGKELRILDDDFKVR
jgi:hypothetical protein